MDTLPGIQNTIAKSNQDVEAAKSNNSIEATSAASNAPSVSTMNDRDDRGFSNTYDRRRRRSSTATAKIFQTFKLFGILLF